MKFTHSTYPDYPGADGSPCWNLKSRWLYFDADWNTRFPFGTSLCIRLGPQPEGPRTPNLNPGFTLDVNAPLGEPNRLYVWLGGGWQVILGLPEFRDFRVTRKSRNSGSPRITCQPPPSHTYSRFGSPRGAFTSSVNPGFRFGVLGPSGCGPSRMHRLVPNGNRVFQSASKYSHRDFRFQHGDPSAPG